MKGLMGIEINILL